MTRSRTIIGHMLLCIGLTTVMGCKGKRRWDAPAIRAWMNAYCAADQWVAVESADFARLPIAPPGASVPRPRAIVTMRATGTVLWMDEAVSVGGPLRHKLTVEWQRQAKIAQQIGAALERIPMLVIDAETPMSDVLRLLADVQASGATQVDVAMRVAAQPPPTPLPEMQPRLRRIIESHGSDRVAARAAVAGFLTVLLGGCSLPTKPSFRYAAECRGSTELLVKSLPQCDDRSVDILLSALPQNDVPRARVESLLLVTGDARDDAKATWGEAVPGILKADRIQVPPAP